MPTIDGTPGDDTLNGTFGPDEINGLAGNDTITGGDGGDQIDGGDGNDTIDGGNDRDFIDGGNGDDVIHAGPGGFTFPESIHDGAGNDTVYGEADTDVIFGSAGDDYYDGGTGGFFQLFEFDEVIYADASAGIVVDMRLASGQVHSSGPGDAAGIGVDTLVNIEGVAGTDFDDVMTASDTGIAFLGGAGNDTLTGGAGDDTLGGGGDDDVMDGGAGIDTADYRDSAAGVSVSLALAGGQDTGGAGIDTLSNIENLEGSFQNDVLTGNDGDNTILGEGGDDTLIGGAGNDYLSQGSGGNTTFVGGDGNDIIETNFGIDLVQFHAGDDHDQVYGIESTDNVQIFGYASAQSIVQDGDDIVVTLSATDIITFHDNGGDVATVQAALHFMAPTSGDDTFTGGPIDDELSGGTGNDTLSGLGGNDTLSGDDGEDVLEGGAGDDAINGGAGSDTASYEHASAGVTVSLGGNEAGPPMPTDGVPQATGGAGTDTLTSIENLIGSDYDDVLRGQYSSFSGVLDGRDGSDVLIGGFGNDTLIGGAGWDNLRGGPGADVYIIADAGDHPAAEIYDPYIDPGLNEVRFTATAPSTLKLYADDVGIEFVRIGNEVGDTSGTAALNVDARDVENALIILGNAGANIIRGTAFGDEINGASGNDLLDGGSGADTMRGGVGNDVYLVDNFNDKAIENSDEGTDTVRASDNFKLGANIEKLTLTGSLDIYGYGNELGNVLTGNAGINKLFGLEGNDTLDGGSAADRMFGGTGNDAYYVDDYSDHVIENVGEGTDSVFASTNYKLGLNIEKLTLIGSADLWAYGNSGNDTLTGNSGANKLYGLGGADTFNGAGGNDWLEGGAGQDKMFGGAGNDNFVFREGDFAGLTASTCDQVKDFAAGDKIRLNFVDANTLVGGDQGFAFVGTAAFSHTAGELRYEQISSNTYLSGDTNGDGVADFLIRLDGLHALSGSDLVL